MSVTFMLGKEEVRDGSTYVTWVDVSFEDAAGAEVNVANSNAQFLLGLIGVESYELVGELSVRQVRRIAEEVDNLAYTEAPSVEYGERGAKVINCGRSLDQLRSYSARLDRLADLAEQYEAFIYYA